MRFRNIAVLTAALLLVGTAAIAAPRDDADHYEYYFPSSDGLTQLHADVLRPKGMADDVKTPIILTVSPYTNHSGSTTPTDVGGEGPNPRFYDFLDKSQALQKGYTYVMVDLPGDGGSAGCNDWGGIREQTAVKDAVEWAASQPWSTGKVALLGKSYDGWTGLMGIAQQPKGLAAVVSLEPVYSGYRYIYMNGIKRGGTWPYGYAFTLVDAMPGRPSDSPEYHANGAPQGYCYGVNVAGQNADWSEDGIYWEERNLLPTAKGKKTPLFLTQGFLETNTKPDGAFEYFNSLAGHQNRGWFGQFDHCRAWEIQSACDAGGGDDRLAVGRPGFVDEVMRFLDLHLKGIKRPKDPAVEVQDILGRWRAESSWPPSDSTGYVTKLTDGSYTDTGNGSGLRPTADQGIWNISKPLPYDVWFSGTPVVTVNVYAPPMANLAANVYDISPDGTVRMISRGVQSIDGAGEYAITLYGQDWPLAKGHRLGVLISSANDDEFNHVPTGGTVTVSAATIELPFLKKNRTKFLKGSVTARLEEFNADSTAQLTKEEIEAAEIGFKLPPPLK